MPHLCLFVVRVSVAALVIALILGLAMAITGQMNEPLGRVAVGVIATILILKTPLMAADLVAPLPTETTETKE